MRPQTSRFVALLCVILLFISAPAHAFRCGSKLVLEDMHEVEVRAVCGTPTTANVIGQTVRNVGIPTRTRRGAGWSSQHWGGYALTEEVTITEYVYNFGPRKLMRRLLFEGGVLVSIETLGYGYAED